MMLVSGCGWLIISYLPLSFSKNGMVSSIVGIFDFSIYTGAALASFIIGICLTYFEFSVIVILWLIVCSIAAILMLTQVGHVLASQE